MMPITATLALAAALFIAGPQQDADGETARTAEQRRADSEALKQRAREFAIRNARQHGYIINFQSSYVSLPLPKPITKDELAHLGDVLELSEAQMNQFDALHEQYLDDGWAWREPNVQPLYDRSAELSSAMRDSPSKMEWARNLNALFAECYDIASTLESYDRKLLEAMRPYLSEAQQTNLRRAMKLRERQRDREQTGTYLGARYDLTEVLFERKQAGRDMTPVDPAHFRNLLIDYENQATDLFRQFADHNRRVGAENRILTAQRQELGHQIRDGLATREELMPRFLPIREQQDTYRKKSFNIERRLHELNEEYIALLTEQLPEETGDELMTWWREEVYRYIWPDPFALDDLLESALRIDSLTDDQRIAIEGAAIEYDTRRNSLTDSMMNTFMTWNDEVQRTNGYSPIKYKPYAKRMLTLQNERRENANKTIALLRHTLNEQQLSTLSPEIERFERYCQQFDECVERNEARDMNWPGPYGRAFYEPEYRSPRKR